MLFTFVMYLLGSQSEQFKYGFVLYYVIGGPELEHSSSPPPPPAAATTSAHYDASKPLCWFESVIITDKQVCSNNSSNNINNSNNSSNNINNSNNSSNNNKNGSCVLHERTSTDIDLDPTRRSGRCEWAQLHASYAFVPFIAFDIHLHWLVGTGSTVCY